MGLKGTMEKERMSKSYKKFLMLKSHKNDKPQNSHSFKCPFSWLLNHNGTDSNYLLKKSKTRQLSNCSSRFLASWLTLGPSTCLEGDKHSQRHFEQQQDAEHLAGRGSSVPGDITRIWFPHTFGKSGATKGRKLQAFITMGGVHWHFRDAFYCCEMSVKRAVQLNRCTDGGASQDRAV